ncbi:MAG: rane protein [Mucilaginibacter sp.]|nr:rane protein [Mucilaginibacter sp.]
MVELSSFNESQKETANTSNEYHLLKRGIWAYFLLLIFEGALRKWVLPGLSNPLLIVRDPIAIWLVYSAWKKNLLPSSIYLYGMILVGLIGFYLAVFVGHGNIIVALFGARILLFHFPMMFVIGRVFTREDVDKMGKAIVWISIPMAILIGLQFHSPQSAWVNRGLAGDVAGAGFGGAGDYFRPPGTFSFIVGTALFFGLLAPFVFYFWLNPKKINKLILISATVGMMAAIPFSISRALLAEVALSMVFTLIAIVGKPEYSGKIIASFFVGLIVLAVLSQSGFFNTAIEVFTSRFNNANEAEGGLVKGVIANRFFGGLVRSLQSSSKIPFWGFGIGMGTNVGSQLLSGDRKFLIDELEWGRLIGELGPLIGLTAIILRVGLTIKILFACIRKMLAGDSLPWLLLSFGLVILAQGGWAQPTALGFFVMIGGLIFAALRTGAVSI